MINIDQLRISDDGQSLYIDAHINKAEYFDKMYIDTITIATEDQVNSYCSDAVGNNYIYKEQVSTPKNYVPLSQKPIVLSGDAVLNLAEDTGGWKLNINTEDTLSAISIQFSGRFSSLGLSGNTKLVVATADYSVEDGVNGSNVLFTIDGSIIDSEYESSPVWSFKGKGDIGENKTLYFYLFKQNEDKTYTAITLQSTDNFEFLHFIYMLYGIKSEALTKEVHLVLNVASFNENYKDSNLSNHMFFVFIKAAGIPAANTPCRLDEATTVGVTFDYNLIYQNALCFTRELSQDCSIPNGFIDFILNYAALKLAIETEHYTKAIDHFKWLLNNGCNGAVGTKSTKPCGCH